MKFALVCGKRTEATKGAIGICPACDSELVARCGTIKVNHWAHKGNRNCDPWQEPETEWHRSWKNKFSTEWQEVVMHDEQTFEKHVADIRTSHGLVIELQHSHIDPEERTKRENFYKNMVWVVDCTRLKKDYPRFLKGKSKFRRTNIKGYYLIDSPDECFPSEWLGSSVPVIFDFRGNELINDLNDLRNSIYCLYPKGNNKDAIIAMIAPSLFINNSISGAIGSWFQNIMMISGRQPDSEPQIAKEVRNQTIRVRESPYVLERGKWKRRRRL